MNNIETETTEDRIISALGWVSLKKDVSILYACESGSRAWGFASENSDYDVRFIYSHPKEWYLDVDSCSKRDVIDGMKFSGPEKLDVVGWDIRKALCLIRKPNASLVEWINSPIRYVDRYDFRRSIDKLVEDHIPRIALIPHYIHMATNNWTRYIAAHDEVLLKKYLYVLRPMCAAAYLMMWEGHHVPLPTAPPVDFSRLLDAVGQHLPAGVAEATEELIKAKTAGYELGKGPRSDCLDMFVESMKITYDEWMEGTTDTRSNWIPPEKLNTLFREILEVAR